MSWSPLGDADSFPADAGDLGAYGRSLAATGALILEQVELLTVLARADRWVADTADAFREQAAELADRIESASGRHVVVGDALKTLSDDLEDLERRAGYRVDEAQALQATIAAPPAQPEPSPDGGPPALTPQGEAQNARRRAAVERMAVLQSEFDGLVQDARDAASTAAGRVQGAIDDSVKDNWWERNAGWLSTAKTVLGWAAAVAGVALVVVAAVATAPVWLVAAAVGLAVATLVISVGLAVKADGSWTDVAFDAVGALSLGSGAVLSRLASRAFPAVRSAVAGTRASQAHRARYARELPANLTELRRHASVGGSASDTVAARQLLGEVRTEARTAAAAVRGSTLSPFPVTVPQRLVDGGVDSSRMRRQAAEMLLDLKTMPVAPPQGLLAGASRLDELSRRAVLANNVGAGSQVVQSITDPEWRNGGNLQILTDLFVRMR